MGTPKFSHLIHATACVTNHIFLNRLLTQDLSYISAMATDIWFLPDLNWVFQPWKGCVLTFRRRNQWHRSVKQEHAKCYALVSRIPEEIRTLTEPILSRTPLPVGLREHNSVSFFIAFFTTQRLDTIGWSTLPLHFHRLDPKAMWKTRFCVFQITSPSCITDR